MLATTAFAALVGCGLFAFTSPVQAEPKGGVVVGGQATITAPAANRVDINQSSQRAVIDWQSFSIRSGEQVNFNQPNASAIALNRVMGPDPSTIAGQLNANGQVILVNPSGVTFANGAQVNVNSLIATTANVSDPQKFMSGGKVIFDVPSPNPNAQVVNHGNITVREGGLVGLVGPSAANHGVINARLGRVTIAGAETATLDLTGDGLLSFQVGKAVSQTPRDAEGKALPLASNTGTINAQGGVVKITARAARDVVDSVVNVQGVVNAQAVSNEGGVVVFGGADVATVKVGAAVDVSGADAGQKGGRIAVTGRDVTVQSTARLDASGFNGGGKIAVGGNKGGKGPLPNAKTTTVEQGATLKADATAKGDGGQVIVWADNTTVFGGLITARGGPQGGAGGFVETSAKAVTILPGAAVTAAAPAGAAGTWLLDPTNVVVDATLATTIKTTLEGGSNFTVDTTSGGGDAGNITMTAPITTTTSNNADVTLTFLADNDISVSQNITLVASAGKTAALSLQAGRTNAAGSIDATGGKIVVSSLIVSTGASGSATIKTASHDIGQIQTTGSGVGSGGLDLRQASSGTGLLVGTIASAGNVTLNDNGAANNITLQGAITVSNANITVTAGAGGQVLVQNTINAGTGQVALIASKGVSQNATGAGITADSLRGQSSSGAVSLAPTGTGASDVNTVNTFAGFANTTFSYRNSTGFSVGTVNATKGVLAGTSVALEANSGAITQTSVGVITAPTLSVTTGGGNATLDTATNAVTNLGTISLSTGAFAFKTDASGGLTVNSATTTALGGVAVENTTGNISVPAGFAASGPLSFVAAAAAKTVTLGGALTSLNGAITLTAGGTLAIDRVITASSGDVLLTASSISQTAAGIITASGLGISSTGAVDLSQATSNVITLAGTASSLGFLETNGFSIGAVGSLEGLTVTNLQLSAGGAITQSKSVSANNGAFRTTSGNIDLSSVTNTFGFFAASTPSGFVALHEGNGVGAGTVGAIGTLGALSGITATTGVSLVSDLGVVSQTAAGIITAGAGGLAVSGPSIDLSTATNATALVAFSGATVSYKTGSDLNVGQVAALGSNSAVTGVTAPVSATLTTTGAATSISQTKAINTPTLTLATGASGQITLTNSGNLIGTLQGSGTWGSNAHTISDSAGGLSVGAITSSGDLSISTTGGALTVSGDVNVGAKTLTLVSTDNSVTATGAVVVTAGTLAVQTGSSGGANFKSVTTHNVGTVQTTGTGVGSGGLTYRQSKAGLTVGAITSTGNVSIAENGNNASVTVNGKITATGKIVNLSANAGTGQLIVNGQIIGGDVGVFGRGGVTQANANAGIQANTLRVESSDGNVSVAPTGTNAADVNTVGTFAGFSTTGSLSFRNSGTFNVGLVNVTQGISAATSVSLQVNAAGKSITQTAGADGAIVTPTLNLTTNDGSVTITSTSNNIGALGTVALGNGAFTFVNATGAAFNVGAITANGGIDITNSNGDLTTSAALVSNGNISLRSTTGSLTLGGTVTSNNNGITLQSKTALDTGAFLVSAPTAVTGDVTLISDSSTVTIGAGGVTAGDTLTIQIGPALTLSINGALTANSVALISDDIAIAAAVNATGTITLAPVTAATAWTLGGASTGSKGFIDNAELSFLVPAPTLTIGKTPAGVTTGGAISIAGAGATVGNATFNLFSSSNVTQGGRLTVGGGTGALNITAGTVLLFNAGIDAGSIGGSASSGNFDIVAGPGTGSLSVTGITTAGKQLTVRTFGGNLSIDGAVSSNGGDIYLGAGNGSNALTLNSTIDAGSGGIALFSATGGISQTAGKLVAVDLVAFVVNEATGSVSLTSATNAISGSVSLNTGSSSGDISFSNTAGYAIGLSSIPFSFGTAIPPLGPGIFAPGGTVTLTAGGSITQGAGATNIVSAATLTVAGLGGASIGVTLDNANNTVTNLGAVTIGSGAFTLADQGGLTVTGAVGATGGITLSTSGALAIDKALNAGGGNVSLTTTGTGPISQSASGVITGATLSLATANSNVALNTATNVVTNLGTTTLGSGSLNLKTNVAALTVTGAVGAIGGITLTNTGGTLAIDQALNAGAGNVALSTDGAISQNASGVITANTLTIATTNDDAGLGVATNVVTNLGTVTLGTGILNLTDNVATVTVTGAVGATGGIVLDTTGALVVNAAVNAGGGNVTFTTGGAISQDAAGVITANTLSLSTTNDSAALDTATNVVTNLGTTTLGTGSLSLLDTGGLFVTGAVGASGGIAINTSDTLVLQAALNAGGGNVSLTTTVAGKAIGQTAAGIITAGTLTLSTNNGDVGLGVATNVVTNLGAATLGTGSLNLLDAGGLTVSGAVGATGGITLNTSGALAIEAALNAGAGNVSLTTDGAISQSAAGVITANTLTLATTNDSAALGTATNVVTNLGAATLGTGSLNLLDAGGLTVTGAAGATGGIILNTSGALAVNNTLNAGAGDIALTTTGAGPISQNAAGVITGTTLTLATANSNVDLSTATNVVTNLGTATLGTGSLNLLDAGGLTVSGAAGATGGITLNTSGALAIDAALNAGAGNVSLTTDGAISQSAAGVITANTLTLATTNDSAALGTATNVVTNLGAATLGTGSLNLLDAGGLTVSGAVGATGGITLNTSGALAVNNTLNAGAGDIALTTTGTGPISQNATGVITGATLTLATANSNVDLSTATNVVTNLGTTTLGTGSLNLLDAGGLTVSGAVGATGGIVLDTTGALAINAALNASGGNVTLTASGDLTVNATVTANTVNGVISLKSTGGSVIEQTSGVLVAESVVAQAQTNVDLSQPSNVIGPTSFAAVATDGFVVFINTKAITLDTVAGVSGVTAGGAVVLGTTSGDITQKAGNIITAGAGLGLAAPGGSITLDLANQITGNIAVVNTAGGSVTIRNVGNFNIGTVGPIATAGVVVPALNGIAASTAAGKFVSLTSDTGTITQGAGAANAVVGNELRIATTDKDATLTNPSNQLTAIGNSTLGTGRLTVFDGAADLTVSGAVVAGGGAIVTTQTGLTVPGSITVANGDITLTSVAGSIGLTGTLSGVNGQVQLDALGAGGAISQTAGTITAKTLIARATGVVGLVQTDNDVGTIAGASTGGTFSYTDKTALTIGSLVDSTAVTVNGLTTANQDITVTAGNGGAAGGIAVDQAVNAGTAILRLQTAKGDITQAAAGLITANSLLANAAAGSVNLTGASNALTFVAGKSGGSFRLLAAGPIGVTDVAADGGGLTTAASGITTTNADIALQSAGNMLFFSPVDAGTGTIRLRTTTGGMFQAATANLTGAALLVDSAGPVSLAASANNRVDTLAGQATGDFSYADKGSFVVGTVTADGGGLGPVLPIGPLSGVTSTAGDATLVAAGTLGVNQAVTASAAGGDVTLQSGGALSLAAAVTANAVDGIVSMTSTGGSIVQTTVGGIVSGSGLVANAATNVDFSIGGHSVSAFAAKATTGFVALLDTIALSIASVGGTDGVTAGGAVFIGINSGDLTQTAAGIVTAGAGLGLFTQNGLVVLDQANVVTGNVSVVFSSANVTLRTVGNLNVGTVGPITVAAGSFASQGIAASTAAGQFVALTSDTGTITQSAAAANAVVGNELRITTNGKDATLSNTSNQLAAIGNSALGAGKLTVFDGAAGLAVTGAVVADGGAVITTQTALTVPGSITSANGDITLTSVAGSIGLSGTLSGVNGQVQLDAVAAGGTIAQTAGAIAAKTLIARADGAVGLTQTANDVGTIAGASTTGTFSYTDKTAVTIGSLVDSTAVTVNGLTTANQDITVTAGNGGAAGGIAVDQVANAGTATVRLQTAKGDLTQAATGLVTGSSLLANAATGSVNLTGASNAIGIVAGKSGGSFRLLANGALNVASVAADGGGLTTAATGITATNADIALQATSLTFSNAVDAGTGTIRVRSTTGGVSQAAAGGLTAAALLVDSAAAVNLTTSAGNHVDTLAGRATAGTFRYQDKASFAVGTVTADGAGLGPVLPIGPLSGVATSNADTLLVAAGALTINEAVNSGAAGTTTVRLQSGAGDLTQGVNGAVTAGTLLAVSTGGMVNLTGATNVIQGAGGAAGRLAGSAATSFLVQNSKSLTITDGTVAGDGVVAAAKGVTANSGNGATARVVDLAVSSGDLTIGGPVTSKGGMVSYRRVGGSGNITVNAVVGTEKLFTIDLTGAAAVDFYGATPGTALAGMFTTPTPPTGTSPLTGKYGALGGGTVTLGPLALENTTTYLFGNGATYSSAGGASFGLLGAYGSGNNGLLTGQVRQIDPTTAHDIQTAMSEPFAGGVYAAYFVRRDDAATNVLFNGLRIGDRPPAFFLVDPLHSIADPDEGGPDSTLDFSVGGGSPFDPTNKASEDGEGT